jgi:hypothetical protein
VGLLFTGVIAPRLGTTYALYAAAAPEKHGTYITMAGDTAFTIQTPLPVDLGTYQAGAAVPSRLVFPFLNNTAIYGTKQKRDFTDIAVTLVQDPGAHLDVTVTAPSKLKVGSTADVYISGTAGATPGPIYGYFHISALNGFVTLNVPAVGTVTAPPAPLAVLQSDGTTPTDPVPEPDPTVPTDPVVEPEPTVPTDPVVEPEPTVPTDPVVEPEPAVPTDPVVAPDPPAPVDPPAVCDPALDCDSSSEGSPCLAPAD